MYAADSVRIVTGYFSSLLTFMGDIKQTDFYRRTLCAAIVFIIAVFVFLPKSHAAEKAELEEWLFEVVMPPYLIADGVSVYQLESRYYLPVLQLAGGLEFYVEPDLDRGYISGWYLSEENSFVIDRERREIIVKGQKQALADYAFLDRGDIYQDDIYIQLEVLNDIWPVNMQVNLAAQSISVTGKEDLVFEERFERRKRREKMMAQKETRALEKQRDDDLVLVRPQRKWLGWPAVDLQANYTFDNATKELTGSNTINGKQQFLGTIADYSANYRYDEEGKIRRPDNIRLRFERTERGDGELPLDIHKVQAGDINIRQRDFVSTASRGRGVFFTSFDKDTSGEFDSITVEGTGPAGWEIELYNNNELIDFGEVEEDGEYRFEDVQLRFGGNKIRAVLYGPQGQVREDVQEFNIGAGMLRPGEFKYSGGFVDADRPFVYLANEPRTEPRGVALNSYAAYGVNRNVTLFASAAKLPTREEDKKYLTAGASFVALNGVGQVEGYQEIGGGNALDVRFLTKLFGVRLNLRNTFFNHFDSPDNGFGSSSKRYEAEMDANKSFALPFGVLGLNLGVLHQENRSGTVTTRVETQQSLSRGGLRFSHSTSTQAVDEIHESTNGRINTTVRFGDWQVRGNMSYTMHPEFDLSSGQAELRYNADKGLQGALRFSHAFPTSVSTVGSQLGYDFGTLISSLDTEYQQERGWKFTMRASTSLSPFNDDDAYRMTSKSRRSAAPVRGRVFLDSNANSVFDEGDEPLEGAQLLVNGSVSRGKTNEEGYVVKYLNDSSQYVDLQPDEGSLGDPYFRPVAKGYRTVPLPGVMSTVDFPIIETGAIDGTVYYENGSPIAGINMQLVEEGGKIIGKTQSAYDGFYTFEFVPPGTYTVRADPSYGVNIPPETVTVAADDLFVYGTDLQLLEQETQESAESEAEGESGEVANSNQTRQTADSGRPAPGSSGGGYAVAVKRVRIGEHPDKVRLVLDLSGPVTYGISRSADGSYIYIDIKDTAWDAIAHWRAIKTPVIENFETKALSEGGSRLILKGRGHIFVKNSAILNPASGKGYRLFIDVHAGEK